MTIPLSKAKEVCTSSEYALVSASRAPKLNKLSPEQTRRLAGRARRALVKWRDLSRTQGRARAGSGGEPGFPGSASFTCKPPPTFSPRGEAYTRFTL